MLTEKKFILENIKIIFAFFIIFQKWNGTCSWYPIMWTTLLWLLISWRRKVLGHQQPWYWPSCPGVFRFQHLMSDKFNCPRNKHRLFFSIYCYFSPFLNFCYICNVWCLVQDIMLPHGVRCWFSPWAKDLIYRLAYCYFQSGDEFQCVLLR